MAQGMAARRSFDSRIARAAMPVLVTGLLAAGTAGAATDLGTHVLRISAELTSLHCSLDVSSGQVVDLGTISPGALADAPGSVDSTALAFVLARSAFGDLAPAYAARQAPIALQVRCKAPADPSITLSSRYALTFGSASQAVAGDLPGAAAGGFVYRLDTGGIQTRTSTGFVLYVRDVSAGIAAGPVKDALARPGEAVPVVRFLNSPAVSADYVADFEVYPGFFWARSARAVEGGAFSTAVAVTLSFN